MEKFQIGLAAGIEYNEKILFSAININGLLSYDKQKKELLYVSPFSDELPAYALHRGVVRHGREAWFIPLYGQQIAIVNMDTYQIEYLKPPCRKRFLSPLDGMPATCYSFGVFAERFLYMLPAAVDAAVLIDLESREMVPIYDVIGEGEYILISIYLDGKIHAFMGGGAERIEIDTKNLSVQRFPWTKEDYGDVLYLEDKDSLLFSPRQTEYFMLTDTKFSHQERYQIEGIKKYPPRVQQMIRKNETVFVFPRKGTCGLSLNLDSMKCDEQEWENLIGLNQGIFRVESETDVMGIAYDRGVLVWLDENGRWLSKNIYMEWAQMSETLHRLGQSLKGVFWQWPLEKKIIFENQLQLSTFVDMLIG